MDKIPSDFQRHYRPSAVTEPWEPLFSRQGEDAVDLFFQVREAHCNSRGFLHGGVLAALCDNVMGLSLGSVLNSSKANIVTINLALDYLGSAKVADSILIEPHVIKAGHSIGFCDATVTSGGKSIARANATFSVRIVETRQT